MQISPKVTASAVTSAAIVALLYFASLAGIDMPETVAGAIITIAVFAAGYFTRDPRRTSER